MLPACVIDYTTRNPTEAQTVRWICAGFLNNATGARDVVEMALGNPMSDAQWKRLGGRWERAWSFLVES